MTTISFTSASSSASVGPFASANLSALVDSSMPASPSMPAGLLGLINTPVPADPPASTSLVLSSHTGLSIIQDMIKPFFIGKPVTIADNTISWIYTKDTIWINGVPFPSLDKTRQYMLGIPDNLQQLKIAKNNTH